MQVEQGAICVKAPYYTPKREIIAFVNANQAWIAKHHAELPPKKTFTNGEKFFHLGKEKSLKVNLGHAKTTFESDHIHISFPTIAPKAISHLLKAAYLKQASQYLTERTSVKARECELTPRSVAIKNYKARWGSCDAKGHIQLNWRLLMCPIQVIDYVIVHELCHIVHFNHSTNFWQLVKHHHPSFHTDKIWLNTHQSQLKLSFDLAE